MSDKTSYILIGASGHAKVVLDILEKSGEKVQCLLELNPSIKQLFNHPVFEEGDFFIKPDHLVIVAVGDNKRRQLIASKHKVSFGLAIHPEATIASFVKIGTGSMIMAKAVINPEVTIGEHCIINTGSVVEHDCEIGDYCHVSPGAVVCGGVSVGEGTQIGAGAVILPGIKIGSWATIGAGAVVTKDVPPNRVLIGNPGKIIR